MNLRKVKGGIILVVGDLIVDTYHTGSVSRISPEAPIPVVRVSNSFSVLGGAANVARNLKALHCNPIVVGVKGNDANGELMDQLFHDADIKSYITPCNYPTITKTRVVGNRQQIVRVDFENDQMKLEAAIYDSVFAKIVELLPHVDAVVLSDYGKGFCNDSLCRFLIEKANKCNKVIIVDPKGNDWYKYGNATFITPNIKELSDVAGEAVENQDEKVIPVAKKMQKQYRIQNVLVTRSEKGMTLVSDSESHNLPTVAKEVFDVSGAGDTVVATLAAALAGGFSLIDSLNLANRAAGIVVGKSGTQPIYFEELTISETFLGNNKFISIAQLNDLMVMLRENHRKVVFTNGCFDVIHMGHVTYLQEARKMGDVLILGLNSDASVKRLKGENRPINSQEARAKVLSAMSCVDYVVVFDEDTPYNLIKTVEPDVLVKGGDYKVEEVVGREFAKEVVLVDFVKGHSSTRIIEQLGGVNLQ
jgi:D-beta-D-heptose 7-phosphate kinase/D-beta-D-heptose 1-phosphate adenosyltransferase